ncbi:MAG: ribosome-binding factor A [Flavobacteriales bacterium]|nr:ribosome-binding factor A [Flavobacteriales bacterium]
MESNRQKKVGRLIQKDLSHIFLKDSSIHYSGVMVSVTHVMITKDLSQAKVYLSLFPKKSNVFEFLKSRSSQIRHQLSSKLKNQLRKTPDLFFYLDNSQEHYDNISSILKDI